MASNFIIQDPKVCSFDSDEQAKPIFRIQEVVRKQFVGDKTKR